VPWSVAQPAFTKSPTGAQQCVKVGWNTCSLKDFYLGRMYIVILVLKKCPTKNKGNKEKVESSISRFCITSWCEFMTPLIKYNTPTHSGLWSPGTSHFSPLPCHSFWMLLDPKWLICSHETRVLIFYRSEVYFLLIWTLGKIIWISCVLCGQEQCISLLHVAYYCAKWNHSSLFSQLLPAVRHLLVISPALFLKVPSNIINQILLHIP